MLSLSTGNGHKNILGDGQEAASDCAQLLRSSSEMCLLSFEGFLVSGQIVSAGLLVPASYSQPGPEVSFLVCFTILLLSL